MRATIVLAVCLVLALSPLAAARLPVGCGYGGPCVAYQLPSGTPSAAQCREIWTTVGTTVACTVGDGYVVYSAYGCQYCLPLTLLDCTEGTDGYVDCNNSWLA